jgi:hypothetical protein
MISWLWLIPAFFAGIAFTVLAIWMAFNWLDHTDDDDWMGL